MRSIFKQHFAAVYSRSAPPAHAIARHEQRRHSKSTRGTQTNTQTLGEALPRLTKSTWLACCRARSRPRVWSKRPLLETIGLKCCCARAPGLQPSPSTTPSSLFLNLSLSSCLSSHLSRAISLHPRQSHARFCTNGGFSTVVLFRAISLLFRLYNELYVIYVSHLEHTHSYCILPTGDSSFNTTKWGPLFLVILKKQKTE